MTTHNLIRDLHDAGENAIQFKPAATGTATGTATATATATTSGPDDTRMRTDIRFRQRFDFDNVELPRGELAPTLFVRKRRSENEDLTTLRMRKMDDHELLRDKPFPIISAANRIPMIYSRMGVAAGTSKLTSDK